MVRYQMRQKLFSIGEDFDITDDAGRRAFRVDSKLLRIRETFVITDAAGREVATITEKKLAIRDTMRITRDGELLATVRKGLLSMLRDRFEIEVENGPKIVARGDIMGHEYELEREGKRIATISKRWFRVTDTYGIDIADEADVPLILAIAVAVDEMAHDPDEEK